MILYRLIAMFGYPITSIFMSDIHSTNQDKQEYFGSRALDSVH